eukprot:SAG31_NODE_22819_length_517_cov_0.818182_1_plen_62_part_10
MWPAICFAVLDLPCIHNASKIPSHRPPYLPYPLYPHPTTTTTTFHVRPSLPPSPTLEKCLDM